MSAPRRNASNLLDVGVSKVMVIALHSARFQLAKSRLLDMHVPKGMIHWWKAVNGNQLFLSDKCTPVNENVANLIATNTQFALCYGRQCSRDAHMPGAIGCYLSHVGIWKHVVNRGLQAVLVCEDDIQTKSIAPLHLGQHIAHQIEAAGRLSAFDVLMVQFLPTPFAETTRRWKQESNLLRTYGDGYCAQCYVVTQRGARRLLRGCLPISMAVDRYIMAKASLEPQDFVVLREPASLLWHPQIDSQIGGYHRLSDLVLHIPKRTICVLFYVAASLVIFLLFAMIHQCRRYCLLKRERSIVDAPAIKHVVL